MRRKIGYRLLLAAMLLALAGCGSGKDGGATSGNEPVQGNAQDQGVVSAQQGYEATATTIELSEVEGSVELCNKSGNPVSYVDGMRLYNGHRVATQKESYAYLALDQSKAIKLNQLSALEVRKANKDLSVYLSAGELYFNVSQKLQEDESLDIRTSTMVTGIRGTAGYVRVKSFNETQIYILEGEVQVTVIDPCTGETRTALVKAGQRATSEVFREKEELERRVEIQVEHFVEEEVPVYIAREVAKDEDIQKRIEAEGVLSVPRIIGSLEEREKQEKEELEEKLAEAQKAAEDWRASDQGSIDEMFDTGEDLQQAGSIDLNDPTLAQVQAALDREEYMTVNVSGTFVFGGAGTEVFGISQTRQPDREYILSSLTQQGEASYHLGAAAKEGTETLTVPAGKTLNLNGRTAYDTTGVIDNYGTIINNGAIYMGGLLNNIDQGIFINNGTILKTDSQQQEGTADGEETAPQQPDPGQTQTGQEESGQEESGQETPPAHTHTVVIDPAVAPTCSASGLTQGSHCSTCNAVLVPRTVVDPLPHTVVVEIEAVEPDCTHPGNTAQSHCSVCQQTLSEFQELPALEHSPQTLVAEPATCEKEGLSEGSICSVCGTILKAQEILPALGHQWGEPQAVWQEQNGQYFCCAMLVCDHDSSHQSDSTVEAYAEILAEPDCENAGQILYTADFGESSGIETQTLLVSTPALGHNWEIVYEWSYEADETGASDYPVGYCTATALCSMDETHNKTERVKATMDISTGKPVFTATFTDPLFETQTDVPVAEGEL